jgi:hypothetical protein
MTTFRLRLLALASLSAFLAAASGCTNFPANKPSALPKPPVHSAAEAP